MSMNRDEWREIDKTGFSVGWRIVAIIAACLLLGLALTFAIGGTKWVTAPFRGAVDQREKTIGSGDYRITAYDSFFNDCNAIKAKERIIARYEEQIEAASGDQKARLQAALIAEQNVRDELIAAYNADASKADTKANFLASTLPYQIDPEGVTTCAL